jgi:HEPN domain-containing protein
LVTLDKIWTTRAQSGDEKSDIVDFYTENKPLYFNKCTILGPRLPYEPERGWEQYITGRNIEKINDKNGVFRYSRIYIQFTLELPKNIESLSDELRDQLTNNIKEKSLQIVNRIIDNYREITSEINVRRLGELSINLIYFTDQNIGFYISNFNITTAMINRSGEEIKKLKGNLKAGIKPDLYKLLLLNAKNSFESKDFTLAIVESFQALEIFLENYLILEFEKKKVKKEDYEKLLEKKWRTKERLNELIKELKGQSLNQQQALWDAWHPHYDKTRNEVIHAGKEPSEKETIETLEINEKVINWIMSL